MQDGKEAKKAISKRKLMENILFLVCMIINKQFRRFFPQLICVIFASLPPSRTHHDKRGKSSRVAIHLIYPDQQLSLFAAKRMRYVSALETHKLYSSVRMLYADQLSILLATKNNINKVAGQKLTHAYAS